MPDRLRRAILGSAAALSLPLSAALGAQQPQGAPAAPTRAAVAARLDSIAAAYVREAPAAGVTVAVVRRGDTLLLKGYGERDRDQHLAADAATVYRIGSITKQFTAAAVLRQIQKGTVKLDDPITRHLPQYSQWSGVTVRHLLNHTSGIPSYTSQPAWRQKWAEDLTPAAIVALVEKSPMDFPTGSAYRYNNTGYMLLGMLLEKVTGKPYGTLLEDEFFRPLGMRSAGVCPSKPTDPSHALGYDYRGESWRPTSYLSMTHPYAAGALCMSVPDYLRWQSALHGARVVTKRSLALMVGPETLTAGEKKGSKIDYGMGLVSMSAGGRPLIQHGGDINGFASQQYWFPGDSLSVVVFVNTSGANQDWLAKNLAAAVLGLPVTPLRPPVLPLAAADREKYVGDYDLSLPDGRILPIRMYVENDQLVAEPEGQPKQVMRFFGGDTFGMDFDPTLRVMFTVEGGAVKGGKVQQRGATMNLSRRP
jgi:D-alanyl-D-alanine carboxypeptidase